MGSPQTDAVAGALSIAVAFAKHRLGLQQEQAKAELKASALSHMVDAFVTRRVDAVKEGFVAILGTYAEQARHYMAQQEKYADKELETSDPFIRVQLRSRIQKIDVELANIRADAKLLYEQMTEVLLAIGGPSAGFSNDLPSNLGLLTISNGG